MRRMISPSSVSFVDSHSLIQSSPSELTTIFVVLFISNCLERTAYSLLRADATESVKTCYHSGAVEDWWQSWPAF